MFNLFRARVSGIVFKHAPQPRNGRKISYFFVFYRGPEPGNNKGAEMVNIKFTAKGKRREKRRNKTKGHKKRDKA